MELKFSPNISIAIIILIGMFLLPVLAEDVFSTTNKTVKVRAVPSAFPYIQYGAQPPPPAPIPAALPMQPAPLPIIPTAPLPMPFPAPMPLPLVPPPVPPILPLPAMPLPPPLPVAVPPPVPAVPALPALVPVQTLAPVPSPFGPMPPLPFSPFQMPLPMSTLPGAQIAAPIAQPYRLPTVVRPLPFAPVIKPGFPAAARVVKSANFTSTRLENSSTSGSLDASKNETSDNSQHLIKRNVDKPGVVGNTDSILFEKMSQNLFGMLFV